MTLILGLGSNMGDRLTHLRQALDRIKKITGMFVKQVSPIYLSDALLPDNADKKWDQPYLNLAVRCDWLADKKNVSPLDLLMQLKNIERELGREIQMLRWQPRIIDIDILAWDDLQMQTTALTIPHLHLLNRPFALWPLADVAPSWRFPLPGKEHGKTAAEIVASLGSRFSGEAPFHTKQIHHRIDVPELVGILNITPDSFSDGGQYLAADAALIHARHLVASGATVLDIGAQSTAPGRVQLTPEAEWRRLEPVLITLKNARDQFIIPPKISIDTYHAVLAKKALESGIDWINDVSGLQDPDMQEIVSCAAIQCVLIHHLSIPANSEIIVPCHLNVLEEVYHFFEKKLLLLEKKGISREKIILDPGIGFGKTAEQSFYLIKNILLLKKLNCRVLVGHSRKSFLSLFTQKKAAERDIETLIISLYLAKQSIDFLRVHDVEIHAKGFKMSALFNDSAMV